MPPKVKITKKMVADASFEVIRANGHENLNARTISEYLGCSTQPVLYSFKTVGEIREAAYEIADGYHTMFIMPKDTDENPMLALGLNVAVLMADPGLAEIMEIMAAGLKVDIEQAKEMFLTFFCVAHGMASLLANNSMKYDEGQCRKMLENVFFGMIAARKGK